MTSTPAIDPLEPLQQRERRRHLLILFGIALAAQMAYILAVLAQGSGPLPFWSPDSFGYLDGARSLLSQGLWSPAPILLLRTPGYPVFLMPGLLSGHVTAVTLLLQCVLGACTVLLVYRLAELLLGARAAFIAALIYAIEPRTAFWASQVLTESLFGIVWAGALFFVIRYSLRGRPSDFVWGGLLIACATFVRPVTMYVPLLVLAAFIGRALVRKHPVGALWRPWAAFAIVAIGLPFMWQLRNQHVWRWRTMSSITLVNMYYMNRSAILASATGLPVDTYKVGWQNRGLCTWRGRPAKWDTTERQAMARASVAAVRQHPVAALKVYVRGAIITLFHVDTALVLKPFVASGAEIADAMAGGPARASIARRVASSRWRLLVAVLMIPPSVALYALAVFGWYRWRGPRFARALMVVIIAYLLAVSSGGSSTGRLRFPMMPVLSIFAAAALSTRVRRTPHEAHPVHDAASGAGG